MKKFIAIYMAPARVLEEWAKTDPAVRSETEKKMQADWKAWTSSHGTSVKETSGLGKTKRVTPAGINDVKNDMMLYSVVEAESGEAAAEMFKGHPHLAIPEATIEIMESTMLPGMQ